MDGRRADPVLFEELYAKPTRISFDEPTTSSDGGVILLSGADRLLGLTEVFTRLIDDPRQPGKVEHTVQQLIRQRIFGIACGYSDCNDSARLASDPMMRLASGRSVDDESDTLASQSTLSRFENSLGATEVASDRLRVGRGRCPTPQASPSWPTPAETHHDRPRSDRRSDAWPAGVRVLSRPLRIMVLSADGDVRGLRR